LLTSPHLLATPAKIWLSLIERNDSQEREREEGTTQMVFTVHDLTFFKSEIRSTEVGFGAHAPFFAYGIVFMGNAGGKTRAAVGLLQEMACSQQGG
jgi:hypothetical protein